MSTAVGRNLIATYRIDASSANIPASSGTATQLVAALGSDVEGIEVINSLGANAKIYIGPASGESEVFEVAGIASTTITQVRQPCLIPKGVRLSIRATANSAIATGIININLWG